VRRRGGFVLLVVLVVVAAAVLAVTGTIFLIRGEVAGTANAGETVRTRAVTWSGVQAVAAALGQARGEILAGGDPLVEASFTVWEEGGERGTVRLLPLGPAARTVVPENAKVDIGRVAAEDLVRSGAFDAEAAARTVAARDACGGRPLDLASLLVHGVLPEDLYGELDEAFLAAFGDPGSDDAELAAASRDAALAIARDAAPRPRGLSDLATVFAFDPPLRGDGSPRIVLSGELDAEDREAIEERFGEGAAAALERVAADAPDEAALLEAWASVRPDPAAWSALLEMATLIEGGFDEGKLDLLRADEAALRALPGLPDEAPARIVREREAVPGDEVLDPAWLVGRGILDAATFRAVLPRLATRSLFWRVRVEGRIEREAGDGEEATVSRTILEAVIDLTGERPRIASLRDVTALPDAIRMLAAAPAAENAEEAVTGPTPENDVPAADLAPPTAVTEPSFAPSLPSEPVPAARSGAVGIGRWKSAR
jgi:hypothetical protein